MGGAARKNFLDKVGRSMTLSLSETERIDESVRRLSSSSLMAMSFIFLMSRLRPFRIKFLLDLLAFGDRCELML